MNKKIRFIGGIAALSFVGLFATLGTASAATYEIYDVHISPNRLSGAPAAGGGLFQGEILGNTNGTNYNFVGTSDADFLAWCIQPTEYLGDGKDTWALTDMTDSPITAPGSTMPLNNTLAMQYLFSKLNPNFDSVNDAASSLSAADQHSAFQLAVWEISYERGSTGFDLTSGDFTKGAASNALVQQANEWLSLLGSDASWSVEDSNLFTLVNDTRQDYIVKFEPDGGPSPVPLPAAGWLFGSALFGSMMFSRRRRKEEPNG